MIDWWALAPAVAAALLVWRARWNYMRLPGLTQGTVDDVDVSVIIPARNEAASVARAVQSFPAGTVIVVDDESSDETAARAEEAGALVIPAPKLPRGWSGKSNACWAGAQTATGRWLLFVDADTWYAPEFLPSLLAYAEQQHVAVASVMPRMTFRWHGLAQLAAPIANGLSFCGVNVRRMYDSRSPQALLNGRCLLMRHDAYDFLGGHKLVAPHVAEDTALAKVLRRHRMKAHLLRAERWANADVQKTAGHRLLRFPVDGALGWLKVVLAIVLTLTWLPCAAWLWWRGEAELAAAVPLVVVLGWWDWYGGPLRAVGVLPGSYVLLGVAAYRLTADVLGRQRRWKGRRA